MAPVTSLRGFDDIGDQTITNIIQANLITFFDWGFIDKGGFFNVNSVGMSGAYGGDNSRLRPVKDPNYSDGQVWESWHKNWVWESGMSVGEAVQFSGVYTNGTYRPASGVGPYSHYVDYPNGRVIFNSPISTNLKVQANYSYKWINFTQAEGLPVFQQLQYNAGRIDNPQFLYSNSGEYYPLGESRLALPTVAVEVVRGSNKPYALGDSSKYCYRDVIFHVFSDNKFMADKICDIISFQEDKTIYIFDTNLMAAQNRFPLDYRGSIASGALTYPQMVRDTGSGGFLWRKLYFSNAGIGDLEQLQQSLYHNTVRLTTEVVLGMV